MGMSAENDVIGGIVPVQILRPDGLPVRIFEGAVYRETGSPANAEFLKTTMIHSTAYIFFGFIRQMTGRVLRDRTSPVSG